MTGTVGQTVFNKNEQWRLDAWNRIEQLRKGDITVTVKDSDGNVINNAEVSVNMYEHEFGWGTAVNANISAASAHREKYRTAVGSLFNSAVLENGHKWNEYDNKPTTTNNQVNALKALNHKYLRGHTLVWDRSFPNGWEANTTVPEALYNLTMAGNRAEVDAMIQTHIAKFTGDFKASVTEWDVLNEPLDHREMRVKTFNDNSMIKDWFAWARAGVAPGTKLYVNESNIIGNAAGSIDPLKIDRFGAFLDDMVVREVDFDGIGIQGHFKGNILDPMTFYSDLTVLAAYNKEMKITEFDMWPETCENDREYEASFTRDIMILAFSQPNMTGFTTWGFWSGSHTNNNAPIFNEDWSLKESGRQFIDLVYNKWWTNESGLTGSDGKCTVRGYYGDYDITVTAEGKTKTVSVPCYKGANNNITIVLD